MGTSCSSCGCNEQTSEFNTGQVQLDDSKGATNNLKNEKKKQQDKPIKKSVSSEEVVQTSIGLDWGKFESILAAFEVHN
jgi:hypothetical protein